jgi:hypothetical protein
VPDVAGVSVDDSGLADGRSGGDVGGHCLVRVVCCMVFVGWFAILVCGTLCRVKL